MLSVLSNSITLAFVEFQRCRGPTEGGSYVVTAAGAGVSFASGATTTAPTGSGELEQAPASSAKVSRQAHAVSGKARAFFGCTGVVLFQLVNLVDALLQHAQHDPGLVGQGGGGFGAQIGDGLVVPGAVVGVHQGARDGSRAGPRAAKNPG